MKKGIRPYHVILIIAIAVFCTTGYFLFSYLSKGNEEQSVFDDLKKRVEVEAQVSESEGPPARYLAAYAENSDYVGWLTVPNTSIDYPVMQTFDDPQYYLHRSFDKTESASGTLFVGENCLPESLSIIIYGHKMKNGSMFGTLEKYKDEAFCKDNPYFYFETATGMKKYEVFAATETYIPKNITGKMYYECVGDLSEAEYAEILNWFSKNSLYDTGIIPNYGENIAMLSTCSYHADEGRFVIIGRRVE